jgi:hypothetical protein
MCVGEADIKQPSVCFMPVLFTPPYYNAQKDFFNEEAQKK